MRRMWATMGVVAVLASSCTQRSVSTVESERSDTIPAVADDTIPDDTIPEDTVPEDTVPDDTVPDDGTDPAPGGTLGWSPCDRPVVVGQLDCATLQVPLDHTQPDGETIDIALARSPATDPDRRIGSLVFNPGGPGGSGVDFLASAAPLIPSEVAARFDLVGFDPRGVGASSAVDCDIAIDDNIDLLAPGDDAGWAALVEEAEALPASCPAGALELAEYVGTNNAARDLDLLREALGDEQLSYVGFSYGTRLGATYAELFPERVRALVLDGAVRPTTDFAALDLEQAAGFDRALESFATACDADEDCLLQELGPTLDVIAGLEREIDEVGAFETDDPARVLTPGELSLGIASALYSQQAWPFLAQALYLAETQADGSLLQVLGDSLVGRRPDGTYDNSQEANRFINCADDPDRPSVDVVRERGDAAAATSRYFADFLRASTGCIGTPDPIDPLVVGPAAGAAPILVIGNTGDPATPYEWSVAMADSLESGVLYTVEAQGHTAYTSIDCVESVVNAYLIDLVVPTAGSSCNDTSSADYFLPAGEGEIDLLLAVFDCLRDNGADIPELTAADVLADPSGEQLVELFDFEDPAFLDAAFACTAELDALSGL